MSLTAPLLASKIFERVPREEREKSRTKSVLSIAGVLISLYAMGSVATLYRTYAHGYHSLKQIFFGTALGCLSHVGLDLFHYSNDVFTGRGPEREKSEMTLLALKSIATLSLYFWLWPVVTAGPAISISQQLFHFILWSIMAANSQLFGPAMRGSTA